MTPPPVCKTCATFLEAALFVRQVNTTQDRFYCLKPPDAAESAPEPMPWLLTAEELHNGCDHHEWFLHSFEWPRPTLTLIKMRLLFDVGRLRIERNYGDNDDDMRIEWWSDGAELLLLNDDGSEPKIALGRVLDREYIQPTLLKQWFATCYEHHGDKCTRRITTLTQPPAYLVDTAQMCLVPATSDMVYLALSYVWGLVPMLKTTSQNLQDLKQPNALERLWTQIPGTIRDAIKLVPQLEERYLWVDSLCIIQDDSDLTRGEIDNMADIFEHALVTIVAADGEDAGHGLRGLTHSSHPRKLQHILSLDLTTRITSRHNARLGGGPWSQRAWTLQECIFSRRKLVFLEGTVQWICRTDTYYEDIDLPHDMTHGALSRNGFELWHQLNPLNLSLNVPDLSVLCELIVDYNKRHHSFEEDVISAISSTFRAMRKAFPRGFIFGIPISFLDICLLWRGNESNIVRRLPAREAAQCPPSWSWAGWKGDCDVLNWTSSVYMKYPPSKWGYDHWLPFQVIPILTWYTKERKCSPKEPIPFQNEWHDYKAKYMGKDHELPPGWIYQVETSPAEKFLRVTDMHRADPECQITWEELQTPYYYEHDSCPGRRFWHPVPIGDANGQEEVNPGTPVPTGRYLCAATQQARVRAMRPRYDDTIDWDDDSDRGPTDYVLTMFGIDLKLKVALVDEQGAEIGELAPDSKEGLDSIWDAQPPGAMVDVVVISRGIHFTEPLPVGKETWSFYNVLWVEWEDGIAYRKGVGRIKRSVWEAMDKTDVDLVLG